MAIQGIRITVVDGGTGSGKWGKSSMKDEAGGERKNSKLYKILNYNQTIKGKIRQAVSPTTFFAIQAGVNVAMQTARQAINYYVSDIGRQNGDSNYQAIVNRRIEQLTDGLSIGQGAFSGAAADAMFGLPGMIVGAIAGAAGAGISQSFKYAERERAYAHTMFSESVAQSYRLARTSNMGFTGRLR